MKAPGERTELDRLLDNGNWVRNLARRLLHDESLVDDVVQEVWITALERPPSRPRALQAWLKTVVRSLALRANRSRRRRQHHESQVPAPPEVSPAETSLAGLEIRQKLIEAILELPENCRSIIYLHYFEELRLGEIARRLSLNESTVRSRLSRGLKKLREKLDGRYGSRSSWRRALLLLVVPPDLQGLVLPTEEAPVPEAQSAPPDRVPASSPTGPRLLTRIFSVALPLFLLVFLLHRSGVFSGTVESPGRESESAIEVTERPRDSAPPVVARPERPPSESVPVSRPLDASRVQLRVLEAGTRAPIPGARVHFLASTEARAREAGSTDGSGLLEVSREALGRDALFVLAGGYREYREPPRLRELPYPESTISPPFTIELEPAGILHVEVRDAGGAPLVGVEVTLTAILRGIESPPARRFETDARGEISYEDLYLDTVVEVDHPGHATVRIPATSPRTSIRLRPGVARTGRLLDARGHPVADCRIRIETGDSRRVGTHVTSDAEGRFSLGRLHETERVTLRFRHDDHPAWRVKDVPPADGVWTFRLPEGIELEGRIVGPDGEGLRGAMAFVLQAVDGSGRGEAPSNLNTRGVGRSPRARSRLKPLSRTRTGDDGAFRLDPVALKTPELYLLAFHATLQNRLVKLDELPRGESLTIRLERGARLEGRVTDPDGQPMGGVTLHVGEIWSNGLEGIAGRTRTRPDGTFALRGVPATIDEALDRLDETAPSMDHREQLFITAFSPDELLALGDLDLEDSPVPGGLPLVPRDGAFEPLEILAARTSRLAPLRLDLRDAHDRPVHTWTPALILDATGELHAGQVGQNSRRARFYSDGTLELDPSALEGEILLRPRGYLWVSGRLDLDPGVDTLAVEVARAGEAPVPLRLVDLASSSAPTPASHRALVGFPAGHDEPAAWIELGPLDGESVVDARSLPPGTYRFARARRSEEERWWLPGDSPLVEARSEAVHFDGSSGPHVVPLTARSTAPIGSRAESVGVR